MQDPFDSEGPSTERQKQPDYSGLIIGVALAPLLILFIYLGKEDLGRSIFVCLGIILLAIRVRWDLRKHVWFWASVGLTMALQVPVVLLVRWPKGWTPGSVVLPLGLVDLLITLGIIQLAEKVFAGSSR
jgi:hypothetical protein